MTEMVTIYAVDYSGKETDQVNLANCYRMLTVAMISYMTDKHHPDIYRPLRARVQDENNYRLRHAIIYLSELFDPEKMAPGNSTVLPYTVIDGLASSERILSATRAIAERFHLRTNTLLISDQIKQLAQYDQDRLTAKTIQVQFGTIINQQKIKYTRPLTTNVVSPN